MKYKLHFFLARVRKRDRGYLYLVDVRGSCRVNLIIHLKAHLYTCKGDIMFKCIYRLPGDKNILDSAQITKMSAAAGK